MHRLAKVFLVLCLVDLSISVKVKVHSEQDDSRADDSKIDDRENRKEWNRKKKAEDATLMPFLKHKHKDEPEETTTERGEMRIHPNEKFFPLIYSQSHVDSMFKAGENWYTWSTEKRTDGSTAVNYYICYDEPKRCDEVGWERTDAPPKCAFQIDSLLSNDRACVNSHGVEPHLIGQCDGADQMKVSEISHACGPRIRTLWRFVRTRRRPSGSSKPADVNSLICEDEDECFVTTEYRIHHDRITFSLHEPTRGQTYKSVLTRDTQAEDDSPNQNKVVPSETKVSHHKKSQKIEKPRKFIRSHSKAKLLDNESKSNVRKNDDSYVQKRRKMSKKVLEDVSEDISE